MHREEIKIPTVYAEWSMLFDKLKDKENDEEILKALKQGKLEWQSGVAERFSNKLIDTINSRLNNATDRFQKEMGRKAMQEKDLVQSLIALRKELIFLADAINLPVIPEKDRDKYVDLVKKQAEIIQQSLEDSAKSDRTGKLASLVRNNKVNVF